MSRIQLNPSGKIIEAASGRLLLDAIREGVVDFDAPCGGKGSCGRCIVHVEGGEVEADSLGILPEYAVKSGFVLACRTRVSDSPLIVDVPEPVGRLGGKFVDDDDAAWLIQNNLIPEQERITPVVRKFCVNVPPPQLEDGLSDLDRLTRTLQNESGKREVECSLPVLKALGDVLRKHPGKTTVTVSHESGCDNVVDIEPGDFTRHQYGIAVDVGTTTVAVQLVSLSTGKIIGTRTDYNAQISCGQDVISRIHYARNPNHLEELRIRILSTINNLVKKVANRHHVSIDDIRSAVVAGNTTMAHLLLGLNPEYIRLEPYTPTFHHAPLLSSNEIGINIHPRSRVFISPSVGSYVGGDITAGMLCTRWAEQLDSVHLFMDIGTNGELVIGNRDFLITCACSAGPAFEGGGIEYGMRAAYGAIEKVEIDPISGVAKVQTIGSGKPVGICGTGMISLLANLFRTGWIDQAGKFHRSRRSPSIRLNGRRGEYILVQDNGNDKAITVSELDIENLIRAKAAIFSAIRLVLSHVSLEVDAIAGIDIAGGFGRFLDLEDAITIGLLPDLPRDRFRFLGNASLMGAYLALISYEQREKLVQLSRRMTYVELNTSPHYMDQYTGAMFIPHTDARLFPSVQLLNHNR